MSKSVGIETIKQIVKQAAKLPILVDVREPSETAGGIIGKAELVPLNSLDSFLQGPNAWPKESPLIFYCMRGGRAQKAADIALKHNYTE